MELTVTLSEPAALTLRSAARTQLRALRRKATHAGTDLNARDVDHLETFIRQVEDVFPPVSKEERELMTALRQELRIPVGELCPDTVDALTRRNRVVWYETPHDQVPNTTWPAPPSAWLALRSV